MKFKVFLLLCAPLIPMQVAPAAAAASPASNFIDVFGTASVQCSGAQIVATRKSLLVFGICAPNGQYPTTNLTISMRRSTDQGLTWQPAVAQPFPPPSLPKVVYDATSDTLVSMGYCTPGPGTNAEALIGGGCPLPATCSWSSADEGATWTASPVHVGNYGSGEGCGGVALSGSSSSGTILMPAGLPNCSAPTQPSYDAALISTDGGKTWRPGGPTPPLATHQGWGECMLAELANGSVVLTSRLSDRVGRHTAPIQRAFAISDDGARTWRRAWTFPASQPFDVGFGPGYNVEHGLISVKAKSKLLLSKPTATLRGDATGRAPNCTRGTQGSCAYRRNLTVSASDDAGLTWSTGAWGLVYPGRVAYSDMAELLPSGKVAVVFERGNPSEEYRWLSVSIISPPWSKNNNQQKEEEEEQERA